MRVLRELRFRGVPTDCNVAKRRVAEYGRSHPLAPRPPGLFSWAGFGASVRILSVMGGIRL